MMQISSYSFQPLKHREKAIAATLCLAGAFALGVGGYLTQIVTATIAYSVLGSGGIICLVSLIYFAVATCKKNALQTRPVTTPVMPVLEAVEEEKIVPRHELSIKQDLLYDPVDPYSRILSNPCRKIDRQEARELLEKQGTEVGDYTFFAEADEYGILVLDEEKKVFEFNIKDPTVWSGNLYHAGYELLKYPILPQDFKKTPDEIHSSFLGFKYQAILKMLECQDIEIGSGVIHDFLLWLKNSQKKIRLDPTIFFKIVGHTFGLLGEYSYTYRGANAGRERECTVNFEGFSSLVGRNIILKDILNDLENCSLDTDVKEKIAHMCTHGYVCQAGLASNPSVEDLMQLLEDGIPITLFTGWPGHAVNITMTHEYLIFTNKGAQAGDQPGMRLYKIPEKVTQEKLKEVLELAEAKDFPGASSSTLETLLQLEFVKTYRSSYQKVGCCVFANNRHCFEAAAILLGVDADIAHKEFRAMRERICDFWLGALFTILDQEEDDENLKTEIYFCFLNIVYKIAIKASLKKNNLRPFEINNLIKISNKINASIQGRTHPYATLMNNLIKNWKTPDYLTQCINQFQAHHREITIQAYLRYLMCYGCCN